MAELPRRTNLARRFAELVDAPLASLGYFLGFMMTTVMVATAIRRVAEWLVMHDAPWVALAFVALAGIAWAALLSVVKPKHFRNSEGRVPTGAAFGFAAAASALWIYVFASFSFVLFKLGLVTYAFKGSPENALPDLCDS